MKTFTKAERISSKVLIDSLIQTGKSFNSFPFRVTWLELPENKVKAQIIISVPKRLFKRAVDRNRLKRLIREGYRKNKNLLWDSVENKTIQILFVYTAKTMMESKEMEDKLISAIQQLIKKLTKNKSEAGDKSY